LKLVRTRFSFLTSTGATGLIGAGPGWIVFGATGALLFGGVIFYP
jgi:hypothetical protein